MSIKENPDRKKKQTQKNKLRMSLILQLISGISRVFKKLLKYFNGAFISISFVQSI